MASRGLPPDEAKARSPSCDKCATAIMRELVAEASKAVAGPAALMQ
jgi:hypothetical protein